MWYSNRYLDQTERLAVLITNLNKYDGVTPSAAAATAAKGKRVAARALYRQEGSSIFRCLRN